MSSINLLILESCASSIELILDFFHVSFSAFLNGLVLSPLCIILIYDIEIIKVKKIFKMIDEYTLCSFYPYFFVSF